MAEYNWPVLSASVSTGPLEFTKNSVTVGVSQDTVTPANSVPLPVTVLGSNGSVVDPATAALQVTGNTSLASIDGKTPALGQALAAASVPITLTALEEGLIGALTETAPATDTASSGLNGRLQRIAQRLTSLIALFPISIGQKAMAGSLSVALSSDQSSIPVAATLQSGSAIVGKVSIDQTTPGTTNLVALAANQSVNVAQINGVTPLMGNGVTGTGSQRVTIASDNTSNTNPWLVNQQVSATATTSNVASSATNVTLLSSNASRKGMMIQNDSTTILYLKYGTTASSTSYTVQMLPGSYYEMPESRIYTGEVDGIWSTANGNARVTELS